MECSCDGRGGWRRRVRTSSWSPRSWVRAVDGEVSRGELHQLVRVVVLASLRPPIGLRI
jgi:hypothetical protein